MSIFPVTLALFLVLLAQSVVSQTCLPCDDVHFFLARGNNEPYPGRQGDLVAATCDGVANCGYENLIYSALFTDLSCQTTYDGCIAGVTQITAYADRCPKSKLILAGYSQGAQIVTDILGGGGGLSFNDCNQPSTPPLDRSTSPGNRLSAVIAFGNTRHTANQPYNFLDGSVMDGLYPRTDSAMLDGIAAYANITRDWCAANDPICANSKQVSGVSTHLGYYNVYSQEAAAWIRSIANIEQNAPSVHTVIPTQISGTAQSIKTVASGFIPPGTAKTVAVTTASVSCPALSISSQSNAQASALSSVLAASSTTTDPSNDIAAVSRRISQPANPTSTAATSSASIHIDTRHYSTFQLVNLLLLSFYIVVIA